MPEYKGVTYFADSAAIDGKFKGDKIMVKAHF